MPPFGPALVTLYTLDQRLYFLRRSRPNNLIAQYVRYISIVKCNKLFKINIVFSFCSFVEFPDGLGHFERHMFHGVLFAEADGTIPLQMSKS